MIIRIRRFGGFAGIEEELGTINSDALAGEAAARVKTCVAELVRLKDALEASEPVGTDMFRYEIEIRDDQGARQKLVLTEDGDPEHPSMKTLRELLAILEASR